MDSSSGTYARPAASPAPAAECPRVTIADRDGLGIATVIARSDRSAALAQRLREHFSIELPQGPRRASHGDIAIGSIGPGTWLVTQERGGNAFAASLSETFAGLASVSDQSDGCVVLRLSGSSVREVLARLVPIDVHPSAFRVDDVAVTVADHIKVTVWRLEDRGDGSPVFEMSVMRSFAMSFRHALLEASAVFGAVASRTTMWGMGSTST